MAQAANAAEQARATFHSGPYTAAQTALNAAKNTLSAATAGSPEWTAAEAARVEAQKKFDRALSELTQLAEVAERAAYQTDRQN
jgi:hypothetical protein